MSKVQKPPLFYKNNINELISKFNVLLARYNKSYPLYQSNKNINEYKSMYENDVLQIQKLFNELLMLNNMLDIDSEHKTKKIEKKNMEIDVGKAFYRIGKGELDETKQGNEASKPRLKEYRQQLNTQYSIMAYNIILLGLCGYSLKKLLFNV